MLAEIDSDEWEEQLAYNELEANGFKDASPRSRAIEEAIATSSLDDLFGVGRGNSHR
jgi:hypothetical protein